MTGPHEQIPFSLLLSPLPNDPPAQDFTLEPWQHWMVESSPPDTTELQPGRLTVLTRPQKYVRARYTLRPMQLHTQHVTASLSLERNYMQPIPPAILALASSLMQEFLPWFSCESIVMTPVSDSSQT